MTYGHLVKIRKLFVKISQILQVQVMAAVNAQAYGMGGAGSSHIGSYGSLAVLGIIVGVCLGVQFHAVGSGTRRGGYGLLLRVPVNTDTGVSLDIELGLHQRAQLVDVGTAYVTLIGTRMYRDALGSHTLAVFGKPLHIRIVLATCVAQCGYLVDIYT